MIQYLYFLTFEEQNNHTKNITRMCITKSSGCLGLVKVFITKNLIN